GSRSPMPWNAAGPRSCPPPGWPGGTPSGCASSTPPAVRRMCGGLSNTSRRHRPLRTHHGPSVARRLPRRAAPADRPRRQAPQGTEVLETMPLLAGLPDSVIRAVRDRGSCVNVAAGEEIIHRWDADRFFYITLSGRYDVLIDDRVIRTLGPGEHFGELAARDW